MSHGCQTLGWGSDFEIITALEREWEEGKDYPVSYKEKDLMCKNRARMWILRIPAWNEFVYRILKVRSSWEVTEFSPLS